MVRRGALAVAVLASVVTAVFTSPAVAGDGDLDPSFGAGGRVISNFGSAEGARGVAVYPDGRIVVAGTGCGGDFLVARYNSDGSPDMTFDGDGWTCIDVGTGSTDEGEEVLLVSGGRLIVAGTSNGQFALVRLTETGGLDPTFEGGGKATYGFAGTSRLADTALSADGKVVMVGETTTTGCAGIGPTPGQTSAVAVARTTSEGALDAGFGGGGRVVVGDESSVRRGFAVAVEPDGAVVVGGRIASCTRVAIDPLVFRLTALGAPDPSFSASSAVFEGGPDSAADLAIQPDGKVVVAIDTFVGPATAPVRNDAMTVIRYNPDGSPDTTFDGDGLAAALFGEGLDATTNAVALQSDRIVVGGSLNGDFALIRFTSLGVPDSTFDGDGKVLTDMGGTDTIAALAVQPDGKLVAAGQSNTDAALARYGTTVPPPSTTTTTTASTSTTTSTSMVPPPTTIPPPPRFASVCTRLQQISAQLAADPRLASHVTIVDAVRRSLACP